MTGRLRAAPAGKGRNLRASDQIRSDDGLTYLVWSPEVAAFAGGRRAQPSGHSLAMPVTACPPQGTGREARPRTSHAHDFNAPRLLSACELLPTTAVPVNRHFEPADRPNVAHKDMCVRKVDHAVLLSYSWIALKK